MLENLMMVMEEPDNSVFGTPSQKAPVEEKIRSLSYEIIKPKLVISAKISTDIKYISIDSSIDVEGDSAYVPQRKKRLRGRVKLSGPGPIACD